MFSRLKIGAVIVAFFVLVTGVVSGDVILPLHQLQTRQ